MATWKTKQMSPTYLLMNSKYPWKILVVMHHGSTENEIHNRIIQNMVISVLIDGNQNENE